MKNNNMSRTVSLVLIFVILFSGMVLAVSNTKDRVVDALLGVGGATAGDIFRSARGASSVVKESSVQGASGRQIVKSVETSQGSYLLQSHAADRMIERNIAREQLINTLEKGQQFNYYHEGSYKKGFYDPSSKVFVGTYNGEVTTVIDDVSERYINNKKGVLS